MKIIKTEVRVNTLTVGQTGIQRKLFPIVKSNGVRAVNVSLLYKDDAMDAQRG